MIKLLTKREIDTKKSIERKSEIDEGVKLSRRVDSLREIQAEEQASLEKFRAETVAGIHKEIVQETNMRDTLHAEVVKLERRREDALRPLDKEKSELATLEKEALVRNDVLTKREQRLFQNEVIAQSVAEELVNEKKRSDDREARTRKLLVDAQNVSEQAEEERAESVNIREKATLFRENVEKELRERDTQLASKERGITLKESALSLKEEELRIKEIQLTDMRATLERAFKRLKK